MGKLSWALIGIAAGAVAAAVVNYLYGPAFDTEYDETYQSRLDHALAEGRRAAEEAELQLRREFLEAKRRRPPAPPALTDSTAPTA
jgi:hypothetical protein